MCFRISLVVTSCSMGSAGLLATCARCSRPHSCYAMPYILPHVTWYQVKSGLREVIAQDRNFMLAVA